MFCLAHCINFGGLLKIFSHKAIILFISIDKAGVQGKEIKFSCNYEMRFIPSPFLLQDYRAVL